MPTRIALDFERCVMPTRNCKTKNKNKKLEEKKPFTFSTEFLAQIKFNHGHSEKHEWATRVCIQSFGFLEDVWMLQATVRFSTTSLLELLISHRFYHLLVHERAHFDFNQRDCRPLFRNKSKGLKK